MNFRIFIRSNDGNNLDSCIHSTVSFPLLLDGSEPGRTQLLCGNILDKHGLRFWVALDRQLLPVQYGLTRCEWKTEIRKMDFCCYLGNKNGKINNDPVSSFLLNFVHNFVHINAVGIGFLFKIAVPTCVHQNFILFVFLWVQHVIAGNIMLHLVVHIIHKIKNRFIWEMGVHGGAFCACAILQARI